MLPPKCRARPAARPFVAACLAVMADAPLQPVDPTTTGEADLTRTVREALKRKRDTGEGARDEDGEWVAPTAAGGKSCVHEVALPPGVTLAGTDSLALLHPRYDGPPAKTYPFTLDPFQQTAVACLVRPPCSLYA
jgi:hypothetical protein